RRSRVLVGWCDVGSALLLVGIASWGTAALPPGSRFLALGASSVLLAGVSTRLSLDPRWYRPTRRPRPLSRMARLLAGPLGTAACLAAALPAPWTAGGRAAVVLISLIPLAALTLTQDQEQTMQCLVDMVQTEAQDGRQAVLDELHGTLSANLRLIEQHSLRLRSRSPRLYELAVGANSRLRETLTLGDPELEDVRAPDSLAALVRTLAMAVGARGELIVAVTELADLDRDLVRLTLNDVVRALLADGAMRVRATIGVDEPGSLTVSVVGSERAGQGLPAALRQLAERLGQLGGSVTGETTERGEPTVRCSWPAAPGTR
ncbi:MAG TPA: hypothetical protein VFP34_15585, partial [Microlunatus sp.]|nr:hypothetical protein [Microlunatus sp.]